MGSQDPGPDTCPPCGEVAPFAEGSRHRETQPCAAEFVASHASRTLHRHLQDLPPSGTRAAVLDQSVRWPGTPASGDLLDTQVGAGMARAAGCRAIRRRPQPQLEARQGGAGVKKGSRVPALPCPGTLRGQVERQTCSDALSPGSPGVPGLDCCPRLPPPGPGLQGCRRWGGRASRQR